jgi:hypothetical protein
MRRYAYGWITLLLFLGSFALHWIFGWYAFVEEAAQHGQSAEVSSYLRKWAATRSRTGSPNSCS